MKSSKKLNKSQVKDIVWSIYESYKTDEDPFKTWGWCEVKEENDTNRKLNIQKTSELGPMFNNLVVESTFDDVYSLHEHRSGDEEEISGEIDNLSKLLWMTQGKSPSEEGRDRLLEILEKMTSKGGDKTLLRKLYPKFPKGSDQTLLYLKENLVLVDRYTQERHDRFLECVWYYSMFIK